MAMKRGISKHDLVAAAATEITLVDGEAPRRVMLLPIGPIALRDGRGPYRIRDRAHAEEVVAATRAYLGTVDFNFDYGHGQQHDQAAIASGWTKLDNLQVEDDGIYADVDWTPAAAQRIRDREYRYISPFFFADKPAKGGDVLGLKNAALVNIPAINMPAIAAGTSEEEDDMSLTAIAVACGLAANATEDAILAKVGEMVAASSKIAIAAGLAGTAGVDEVTAAVTSFRKDYVPSSIVEPMRVELARIKGERLDKIVDDLVAAGVVIPSKKKDTRDWFEKDEVAAAAFFKDLPPTLKPGELPAEQRATNDDGLTADEVAACTALGVTPEAFLAVRKSQEKAA
ncbi:phage protease [Sphingobium sp. sgz301303]|uniref:phage protease n=2 Tax=unclassified Sphingobium TaxID=2611147 RepID=UPI0035A632F9